MGMFSYMCRISGEQIVEGDNVRLYRLKDGKVIEEIRGNYNCYGAVELENQTYHGILKDEKWTELNGDERTPHIDDDLWLSESWDVIVDEHFGDSADSGICAVLESEYHDRFVPEKASDNDPDQGCRNEDDDWYDDDDDEDDDVYGIWEGDDDDDDDDDDE